MGRIPWQPPIASMGSASSEVVQRGPWPRRTERFAGWFYPPQEEVPVSSSCSMQGLLIAENAG